MSSQENDSKGEMSQESEMEADDDEGQLFSPITRVSVCNHPSCSRCVGCNQTPSTPSYSPAPLGDGNGN